MSIATPQELVSHAVAGGEIASPANAKDRAKVEAQKRQRKNDFGGALEAVRDESSLETQKLHQITHEFGTKINDNGQISAETDIDPATGKSEKQLLDNVQAETALLQKLTELGYQSSEITGAEKAKIRDVVRKRLLSNSAISKDLEDRQSNGTLDTYIDELVQNPAFLPRLKEIVNGYAKSGDLDSSFLEKSEDLKNSEADVEAARKKVELAQAKIDRAKQERSAYEKDPTTGTEGPFYQKLTDLKNQGGTPQEEVASLEGQISEMRDEISMLERQTNVGDKSLLIDNTQALLAEAADDKKRYQQFLDTELAKDSPNTNNVEKWTRQVANANRNVQSLLASQAGLAGEQPRQTVIQIHERIDKLRSDIRERERELATKKTGPTDLATLTSQYESLRQQEDQALKELADANADVTKAESAKTRAKQEYDKAVGLRKAQQETLSERLSSSYGEAAHRLIVDQMIRANGESRTLLDELQKEAVTEAEKALLNSLSGNRWHQPQRTERRGLLGFRRTITYRPIDRGAVNRDWRMLLNEGDDTLLKDMLAGSTNPDTRAGYTQSEITDIFKDKEAVDRMRNDALKSLMLKRIQNGGITPEDNDALAQRLLGKTVEEAFAQNEKLKQQAEKLMEAGGLERHDYKARLDQVVAKHPWMLLSILGFPIALIKAYFMDVNSEAMADQG